MARIIYGSIITDIAGSIGGITYQKNGSGTIARLKPRKTKTNTQKQRDQQPRLKQVQKEWNELSLVNKILWNDFANLNNKIGLDGAEKVLTGYQWFLTINQNRLLFKDSILNVPPTYEIVNPTDSIIFTFADDILRFAFSPTMTSEIKKLVAYVSFVENSASKFDFNKTRMLFAQTAAFTGSARLNTLGGLEHWSDYYNQPFPPNMNNKSFYLVGYCRFIGVNSGISSLAYTTIAKFVWDGVKYVIE